MSALNAMIGPLTRRLWHGEPAPPHPLDPRQISQFSSPPVPNGGWCSSDFLLGAGMVIFQRNTNKIVMIFEKEKKYWFFPRGRKDLCESLEQTALREAHEESGYRTEFLPLYNPTRAPAPPSSRHLRGKPNTEPIYLTIASWRPRRYANSQRLSDNGGEYLVSWYVGQIAEDAIPDVGTRMNDEQNYETHLLTYQDAYRLAFGQERDILEYAWAVYVRTMEINLNNADANSSRAGP